MLHFATYEGVGEADLLVAGARLPLTSRCGGKARCRARVTLRKFAPRGNLKASSFHATADRAGVATRRVEPRVEFRWVCPMRAENPRGLDSKEEILSTAPRCRSTIACRAQRGERTDA